MPVSKESPCPVKDCKGRKDCAFLKWANEKGKVTKTGPLQEINLTIGKDELAPFVGCKQVKFLQSE